MTNWIRIGCAVLALAGCKGKSGDGGGGGDGPEGAYPPAARGIAPPGNPLDAWQGAWLGHLSLPSEITGKHSGTMAGELVAYELKGTAVSLFTGKDLALTAKLESPCQITFPYEIKGKDGSTETYPLGTHFVIQAGKLVAGEGAVGYRKGKTAVVCGSDLVTVDATGACVTWHNFFKKWESRPETCAWSTVNGKDTLTIGKEEHFVTTLYADGDVLRSEGFDESVKENLVTKAADFATAKAAVTAALKANDPGEQAKALGGKVGDLTTVLGLAASYAADKTLKGKPVTVTALLRNNGSFHQTSGSAGDQVTRYNATLVDSDASSKIDLSCEGGTTAFPDGLKQGDKVTATGTIGDSFDKPSIEGCTLAKAP